MTWEREGNKENSKLQGILALQVAQDQKRCKEEKLKDKKRESEGQPLERYEDR